MDIHHTGITRTHLVPSFSWFRLRRRFYSQQTSIWDNIQEIFFNGRGDNWTKKKVFATSIFESESRVQYCVYYDKSNHNASSCRILKSLAAVQETKCNENLTEFRRKFKWIIPRKLIDARLLALHKLISLAKTFRKLKTRLLYRLYFKF